MSGFCDTAAVLRGDCHGLGIFRDNGIVFGQYCHRYGDYCDTAALLWGDCHGLGIFCDNGIFSGSSCHRNVGFRDSIFFF